MIKRLEIIGMALFALLALTAPFSLAGSIFDPDDPAGFTINTTVSGSFDEDNPVNYFLFSASADGQYVLSHSVGNSLFVRVYAAEPTEGGGENIIAYQIDSGTSYYALQAGTYKISVLNQSGTESFSYTLSNTYAPPTFPADVEPNDTTVQAFPLVYGDVFGHQGYAYDAYGGMPVYNRYDATDVWKFTTEKDGYFIVDSVLEERLDFDLYLYDESDQLMLGYYESDTLSNVEHQLAAGTYYIKTNYNSGFGSYSLTTSLEEAFLENDQEPNDERATAATLAVGGEDTGHLGFTDHANDSTTGYYKVYDTDDFWKITTAEDGILTVATTSNMDFDSGPYSHLYIYSAGGGLMHSNYNSTESLTMESSIAVAAGTYYVKVKLDEGYGSYLIGCELAPASLTADTGTNDTKEEAVEIVGDEPITGHLGFIVDNKSGINGPYNIYDTDDYWKISYDSDRVLEFNLHSEGDFDDALSMYLYVYNEKKQIIHSNYNAEKLDTITSVPLPRESGYVYVHARHVSGYGSYTLSPTLTPGARAGDTTPNDTMDDATQLPITGMGTGHLGFIKDYTDTVDYWTFYADKEDTLIVTATSEEEFGEGPVLYLKLLQTNTLVTDYNYDYGQTTQVSYPVSPGTYYASVSSRSGYGSYTISVSYPSDAAPVRILTETLDAAAVGVPYSLELAIDYAGEEAVSYALLDSPVWLTLSDGGVLGGTPGIGDAGTAIPVTIRVSTAGSEDILETSIMVGDDVAVGQDELPNAFHVDNPYPNPFNAGTTVTYSLPQAADVRITVYNALGQSVYALTRLNQPPGHTSFTWNGKDLGGNAVNSGVYFIKVSGAHTSYIRKALYMK